MDRGLQVKGPCPPATLCLEKMALQRSLLTPQRTQAKWEQRSSKASPSQLSLMAKSEWGQTAQKPVTHNQRVSLASRKTLKVCSQQIHEEHRPRMDTRRLL